MEGELLRISDVGYGHGACNAFDGDEVCGAEAEWIASEGMRKGPNDGDEWEPFRFCKRHWARIVRLQAQLDQERAFVQEHGFPEGIGLASLVCHVGVCLIQERKAEGDPLAPIMREQRRIAVSWLRHWISAQQDDLESVCDGLDKLQQWAERPGRGEPLAQELMASYHPETSQQFRVVRSALRTGVPVARRLLQSCLGGQ